MANSGWDAFRKYALAHGVHNGPTTIRELHKVYNKHKGSQYKTIVALFKSRGEIQFMRDYEREMGGSR